MVWSDEVGPVHLASGMPVKIVQGAQYMNDAMGSVFGKFTQAVNNQKSIEFRGGIWDCSSVKETVSSEPSCMDTSNNSAIKIYSLDEMLTSDDEYATCDDAEMKDDELRRNETNAAESIDNASCTDVSDVNNKRWRPEEFDKTCLLCNEPEIIKKKPKKTVSFSDVVIDLEAAPKSASKISKFVTHDVALVKDNTSGLKETVFVNGYGETKNLVITCSEIDISDVPIITEDKMSALTKKSESKKVKDWRKLISQSSEIDCDQQIPVKSGSSNKLSREKHKRESSLSDDIVENETVSKRIVDKQEVKNNELENRNHLEILIPELFECNESKTEKKADPRLVKKIVKDELKSCSDDLTSIRNLALEIKMTSQSSKKNSNAKSSHSHSELNFSKNEIKSKTFKEDIISNETESNEDCLKNSLLKMFNDSDIVESLTIQLKELAEQNKRKEKLLEKNSLKEQTCNRNKSEDESSQYEMENSPIPKKKECCPPVCDKPSCNQQTLQKDRNMDQGLVKVAEINASVNRTDYKSGKVSPTSFEVEKNCNPPVSYSRSDSCSNWRSQCIDVRSKDTKENTIPQRSATANWSDDFSNPKCQPSKPDNHKTRRVENFKKMQANKMDILSKTEYEGDEMVVVPIYLKEPPEPSSRFKDINADPESIWDSCEETRPSQNTSRIQTAFDFDDMKNNSQVEEVHAQLFRKTKMTSVPRFFDNPAKTFTRTKAHEEISEDARQPSLKKISSTSSVVSNENYRSRSQSRQENYPHRSYQRNRSSSIPWRSSLAVTSLEQDILYIVKIKNLQDSSIEKLKIFKDDFLLEVRGNSKLLDIIPSPGHKPRKIDYSACAVKMFVRCLFYPSYEIPSCITALEGFALAKKYGVENLKAECEAHFTNYKIPSNEIQLVSACAHQLQAVEALKSSKYFQKVQNFKCSSPQTMYSPQSCIVSCSVLVDPSELVIPLTSTASRGLESCNESDIRNRLSFVSLAHGTTLLSGIQLKFLTEDNPQLIIVCEVKRRGNAEKLFDQVLDKRAQSSVKIPFKDEIAVKYLEEIEIVVYIADVLLKICPQLSENEVVRQGKFRTKFESSKSSSQNNRRLFCIEKMFYTQTA